MSCLAVTTALVSCSKDDEDKVNAPDSLIGTSWLWESGETITTEDEVEVGIAVELDFTTSSKFDINILVGGVKNDVFAVSGFNAGTYNYTYSKPNVTFTVDGEKETGVIDGKKLTLKSDGETIVFIKED
ncbi:MAG: hypothetical protein LBG45_10970 [Dysgonamonadaceae bacterium]|nr:hypothetical protein [Dysgonamonadaceae bacterium]